MTKLSMKAFQQSSYLSGGSSAYLDALYEDYLKDPQTVDPVWRRYFESLSQRGGDVSHASIREAFKKMVREPHVISRSVSASEQDDAVDDLIAAYRRFGHLNAKLDPLGTESPRDPRLQLGHYGLSESDLDKSFSTRKLFDAPQKSLKEIYDKLRAVYCGSIGLEFSVISDETERNWLREYVEHELPKLLNPEKTTQHHIMQRLIAAEELEKHLDRKYIGQKRFSVEGGDSLIPLLDAVVNRLSDKGLQEIVIAMSHRGRLNVLLNIMGYTPLELYREFEGRQELGMTSGDVKYHRGCSCDLKTEAGQVHLSLAFNPSHLEFICPVAMGSVRARQEQQSDPSGDYATAVMIHGDAAFSAQGVVMETLSMSQTRAHGIGGSVHIVLNNQVGFTMSNPVDSRSSHYCTDLARMLDAPIFHVNADDAEAVVAVAKMACDYRMRFKKDVFIEFVCYRRHGHQEVDEPTATQPIMYQKIKSHPTTATLYRQKLVAQNACTEKDIEAWTNEYRGHLEAGRQVIKTLPSGLSNHYASNWTPFLNQTWQTLVDTTVSPSRLKTLGERLCDVPEHFVLQRQVAHIMASRKKMMAGEQLMDWGYGETLAYASLLTEGYSIRLVGEDSRRGTFFHRHSTLFDQKTGEEHVPLQHVDPDQGKLAIYDSLLSETGALGFEYGYSATNPKTLVIWEAQFGDFANVAQVIIDQFISSGWQKWNRLSGLVMFLPHGYEGMGPEHSSARLERYLQLCAQDNIQVCVPSTPAQIFHLLRRQMLRPYRKPLIVMTPKSLLRHKLAVSSLDELTHGALQLVIPEVDKQDAKKVKRVVLCSGKVYYDLLEKRREMKQNDVAILRVEQLYPFPYDELQAALAGYTSLEHFVWCQEEPKNQGAWFCTRHRLQKCSPNKNVMIQYAGREASAAPAVGYPALHKAQQEALVNKALGLANE